MGKVYCHICKKRCKGDVLKVQDRFIHKSCFLCCCCNRTLEKGGFFLKDDKYYCKHDYLENFGVKCNVCNEIAEGEVIVIFATTFHPNCFKCKKCLIVFQRGDKVTLCNGEYLCNNCIYEQSRDPSTVIEKDPNKLDSTLTLKHENDAQELDVMTTSLISTVFSDSSETESLIAEKRYSMDQSLTNVKDINRQMSSKMDGHSTDSECLSIRTEPEMTFYNKLGTNKALKDSSYGGSISSLKPAQSPLQFGKFYNFSYLSLEEKMKNQIHSRANYKTTSRSSSTGSSSNIHHYHKTDNFSYRTSPNVTFNKKYAKSHMIEQLTNGKKPATTEMQSVRPDTLKSKTISNSHMETESSILNGISLPIINDVNHAPASATSPRRNLNLKENHMENRSDLTRKKGLSMTLLDPISASRVPNASYEPGTRQRYDRHMFSSPSRQITPQESLEFISRSIERKNIVRDLNNMNRISEESQLLPEYKSKPTVSRSQVIYRKTSEEDHISVQSFLRSYSREKLSDDRKPKFYSYENLKVSNVNLPKGVDRSKLEIYLSEEDFEKLFKLPRLAFNRLPEWKRNDLKKRIDLF